MSAALPLSSSRSTAPREQTYWWLHCSSVVCGLLQLYIDHNTYLMGSWSICQYLKLWEGRYRFMAFFCSKFWQDALIPQPMNNIFISINVAQISLILGRRNELQHHCRRRNCFIFVRCKNGPWPLPLPLSAQGNSLIFPEAAVHLEITITTIQPTKVTFFIFSTKVQSWKVFN